jgi:hypothetical protein
MHSHGMSMSVNLSFAKTQQEQHPTVGLYDSLKAEQNRF